MIATIAVIAAIAEKKKFSDRWRVFVVSYDRYILIAGIVFFPSAIAAITAMVAIIWKPGFKLIMAYFKSKDCLQRNLYLKCVSL